jgi:hypothetical protein
MTSAPASAGDAAEHGNEQDQLLAIMEAIISAAGAAMTPRALQPDLQAASGAAAGYASGAGVRLTRADVMAESEARIAAAAASRDALEAERRELLDLASTDVELRELLGGSDALPELRRTFVGEEPPNSKRSAPQEVEPPANFWTSAAAIVSRSSTAFIQGLNPSRTRSSTSSS